MMREFRMMAIRPMQESTLVIAKGLVTLAMVKK
jgi:hypothetical protein